MPGLGPHAGGVGQGRGFWAQQPYYNISINAIYRPIWRSLPEQHGYAPANAFQSWTYSYNLNLIGQDKLPTGEQIYDLASSQRLPDQIQLRSWQWQYNLNLIGKDRLPVGKIVTDVPQQPLRLDTWLQQYNTSLYSITVTVSLYVRPPITGLVAQPPPLLQQSAFPNFLTLQPTVVTYIIRQSDWPNPTAPAPPIQSWVWNYNLNLIGKDAMLAGEQRYELAPSQVVPDQIQLRSWQWSYNLSLIGRDRLPTGEQVYDLSPKQVPPEQTQLHSWSWSYNLNLIGKDALVTGEQVYDLPPPQRPPEQIQLHSWSWQYNINLIGQDRMIVGKQVYDRPTLAIPPAAPTWTYQYNPNLIGQDLLPFRQQDWPIPRAAQQPAFSWTDVTKIWLTAPVLNITISQYFDRPQLPVPPAQTWTASYLLSLIGQDRLPFRQQDWPLPTISAQAIQTWIDQTKILLAAVQRPFVQTDWPLSFAPQQAAQSWTASYNLNLIGQDKLPFRQSDWPLTPAQGRSADLATWIDRTKFLLQRPTAQLDWPNPTQPARDPTLSTIAASYNRNLVGQDRLPFNQRDWPLSPAHALSQIPLQIMVAGKPFFLVPVQPLPPGVQFHGILYDRFIDPQRGAADLANPAWRWPQITPPPVTGVIPLRTLMGTGI